jgi:hypothetical protein
MLQRIRSDRTHHAPKHRPQNTAAELVAQEPTAGTADQCCAEASLAVGTHGLSVGAERIGATGLSLLTGLAIFTIRRLVWAGLVATVGRLLGSVLVLLLVLWWVALGAIGSLL